MLERIEASQQAYDISRTIVVGIALGSIVLALGLATCSRGRSLGH